MGTAAGKVVIGGGGQGTVSLVESTDGSVTVTGGSGPTVNLSVPSGKDGINQLTGDVTAGPGVGSQNATLVATANVISIIQANQTAAPVTSVFTRTGAITAANGDYTVSQVTGAAPLASPTFTGTPAAPTATAGTNTTQLATTAFVSTALGSYLALAGGTMSGAIAMGTNKITGLGNGSAAQDAAAFGQIPVPANGYGVTGNTGATPTPAVSLTNASGVLGSSLNPVPTTTTTLLTTASLGVGTWLLSVSALVESLATGASGLDLAVVVGTATATFGGPQGGSASLVGQTSGQPVIFPISFTCIVTVTVAGTLLVTAKAAGASNWEIRAQDYGISTPATGYTGVRIA